MLDPEQFEKENPAIEIIETMGTGPNSILLTRSPRDGSYYARGPFGKSGEILYILLGNDLSTESKQTLLAEWRRRNQAG